jgi:hypothetical protein
MIAQALETLFSFVKAGVDAQKNQEVGEFVDSAGRQHLLHGATLRLNPPAGYPTIHLRTLAGLVEAFKAKLSTVQQGEVFVRCDVDQVQVLGNPVEKWGGRPIYIQADFEKPSSFQFSAWLAPEAFQIEVQSKIIGSFDRERLLKLVANITSGPVKTATDDGISQEVTVKAGVTLLGAAAIKNPFSLQPYRTFAEISQPASDFIVRVREVNGQVQIALFEADGGQWRQKAREDVGAYLHKELPAAIVIA